jgi:hypothetical protein
MRLILFSIIAVLATTAPAYACTNPAGVKGQITMNGTYNVTHEVAQYCDGARWIAIGKAGP